MPKLKRKIDGTEVMLCKRCRINYYTPYHATVPKSQDAPPFPALSRTDNETYICSDCGTDEAIRDFTRERLAEPWEWPVEVSWSKPEDLL